MIFLTITILLAMLPMLDMLVENHNANKLKRAILKANGYGRLSRTELAAYMARSENKNGMGE